MDYAAWTMDHTPWTNMEYVHGLWHMENDVWTMDDILAAEAPLPTQGKPSLQGMQTSLGSLFWAGINAVM